MKHVKQFISEVKEAASLALALLLFASAALGQVTVTNITPLGDTYAGVLALNNTGQAVGYALAISGTAQHAVLSRDGVLYDLGTLGGSFSIASAINTAGQVAGSALTANDLEYHAFVFSQNMIYDLGTLGGVESSAVAINNATQVAGDSQLPGSSDQHAFLYTGGQMVDCGTLGGPSSSVSALNNLGQVVGYSDLPGGTGWHAFLYGSGVLHDLGTLGGTVSASWAINDAGLAVGDSETSIGETHAFIVSQGVMNDLGTLGGVYSSAYAINNSGQVVGDSSTANEAQYHSFLWQGGVMLDLGTLGGDFSSTAALNNHGQVIGNSEDASHVGAPFLWQKGAMVNLNSLLPSNSGWVLASASLINDAGQIAGYGSYNGSPAWYLLALPPPNHPPVADAGPNQTVECPSMVVLDGSKSSDPDQDPLTFDWTEGGVVLGHGANVSTQLPLGSHTITLTVTDSGGLNSQSTVTINVVDTVAPTVVCPGATSLAVGANCQALVPDLLASLNAADACAPANQLVKIQNPPAGTPVGLGAHTIVITVTDGAKNVSTCATTLTVADSTPPVVICPAPVFVQASRNCDGAVPDFLAALSTSDNCTPMVNLVKTQTPAAGTLLGTGPHAITVRVADAAGNVSTCTTTFTVGESKAPVLHCPASSNAKADETGSAPVPDLLATIRMSDNCTPLDQLMKNQTPVAGTRLGPGAYPVTVTVTDAAGNVSSCTTVFTVLDKTAPIVSVPTVIEAPADALCQAQVPDLLANLQVTDNCTPASQLSKTQNPPAGTSLGLGQHSITVTVTDAAGNTTTRTVRFKVVDATAPVIQSATVNPSVITQITRQMVPITLTVAASDNCDSAPVCRIVSITSSDPVLGTTDTTSPDWQITGALTAKVRAELSASGADRVYTITVRCTDTAGNISTKAVTVVVRKPGNS